MGLFRDNFLIRSNPNEGKHHRPQTRRQQPRPQEEAMLLIATISLLPELFAMMLSGRIRLAGSNGERKAGEL
jgi:hypothetical protein